MTKKWTALVLATVTALAIPAAVSASWVRKDSAWNYIENDIMVKNGWKFVNQKWYFFDQEGVMKTGWILDQNNWYYCQNDGSMVKGWLKSGETWYFMNNNGVMQKSIIQVDGVNYDMGTDGKMKETTPVGYPYAAYSRNGTETAPVLPVKNGKTAKVTIWEGSTLNKIAQTLNDRGICSKDAFLQAVNQKKEFAYDGEIPADGSVFYRYEGYLFPDTYEFYMYESPDVVIQKMMNNFDHKMSDELLAKIRKSGYSLHEVMTLASIVQGEAGDSVNMAKVAAVYINRLNNVETFPKLQANPTTNYAKQQILPYRNYGKNADLAAAAYDCYQSDGLPPGPINNPGLKAITAVLEPNMTCDAYFFCTDRVTKEFYYAKTYEEHKANTVKAGLAK